MEIENAAEDPSVDESRRRLLKSFIGVFTSLIGIALAAPFVGSIIGGSYRSGKRLFSKAAPLEDVPVGRPVDIAFTEMASDGFLRRETVRHVWVVRRTATEATVFSPICPHLGCRYDWDPADSLFKCPCHASVFRPDGTVVAGPAARPLDALPAEVRDGVLFVAWEEFKAGSPRKRQV